MTPLILASSSPYRRELLARLGLPFESHAPNADETALPGEPPRDMVQRLARIKAEVLAPDYPRALIIGSDQCAELDGRVLGKPGSHERAVEQLTAASGREVTFHTGLCLYNALTGHARLTVVPYRVRFRSLDPAMIEDYLLREKPYDCAGSFRSEGLGVALFESMAGDDPSALIGLPLIALVGMLRQEGVAVLGEPRSPAGP